MSTADSRVSSYFWLSACLLAASIEPVVVKLGYANNCTPVQLLCIKSLVGAMVILPLTRQFVFVGYAGLKQILPLALLLLATGTLMLFALQYIQATLLITIMTVTPAAVAIVNQALGRETLGLKFWMGFLLCALGLRLTGGADTGEFHVLGLAAAFLAVASSCTYRVLMEKATRKFKPALISTYIFLINGILVLPVFLLSGGLSGLGAAALGSGLWLGLSAAVANVAFLYAISLLGATRVSILTMLQRPLVIALAALILHEALGHLQILGIISVLLGVQIAEVKRRPQLKNESEEPTAAAPAAAPAALSAVSAAQSRLHPAEKSKV